MPQSKESMSDSKESNDVDPPFRWGIQRGLGGAKKDTQFYESFVYDGIEYSLYDCVYLFKEDEVEPYIGKIVKIWEHSDRKKRVKILWFFRPNEILNHLGNNIPLEKEIFLACGEGVGLANINPLEAIAGKCHVICTSKDARNHLPSNEEVEMAEYFFYRTFDVGKLAISDKLEDQIAGVEVTFLLNWKVDAPPNLKAATHQREAKASFKPAQKSTNASIGNLGRAAKVTVSAREEKLSSAKARAYSAMPDDRPLKKMKESCEKITLDERKGQRTDEFVKRTSPAVVGNNMKLGPKILEVTRKPDAERNKWFKGLPWDAKLQKAEEQGRLILLDNLDPGYTSSDVENIVYTFSDQNCSAKVIHQAMYEDPNYGRAYVVFKSRDAADAAVHVLNKQCLLQQSGRPLVCSKGSLKVPKKPSKFTGHLFIPKMKRQLQQEEMRKPVSTSHCSQPNTIEYEMALDWILVQEKSDSCFRRLHKKHTEDIKQERYLKSK